MHRLRAFLSDPGAVDRALPSAALDAPAHKRAVAAAEQLAKLLDDAAGPSRANLLRAVLRRIQVHAESVELEFCSASVTRVLASDRDVMESLISGSTAHATPLSEGPEFDETVGDEPDPAHPSPLRLTIRAAMRRRGNEMKFVVEGENAATTSAADPTLVRLIVRARLLARRIRDNPAAPIEEIAAHEGFGSTYAGRLLRLTSLAPDIVTAILEGRQPPELTANVLMADTRLPLEWSAQRAALGF